MQVLSTSDDNLEGMRRSTSILGFVSVYHSCSTRSLPTLRLAQQPSTHRGHKRSGLTPTLLIDLA